jgi:hypothetical protein
MERQLQPLPQVISMVQPQAIPVPVPTGSPATSSYSPIFKPEPPAATLSYREQVEKMSKTVEGKINSTDLQALLKWVTEGHLLEVEKLLKKNVALGLGLCTVKDLSERTFKNITALQYAVWALDTEMSELIINYIGAHNASIQMKALSQEPSYYSAHGARYEMKPLITKTKHYVDNYSKWDDKEQDRYWQKEVGGEQRKCPAWLIYAWSEEGKDVAWTKQDATRNFKREYDKNHLVWWFTANYNSGSGAGSTWAAVRGPWQCISTYWSAYIGPDHVVQQDLSHLENLNKYHCDALQRVEANSASQLGQVSTGSIKKQ